MTHSNTDSHKSDVLPLYLLTYLLTVSGTTVRFLHRNPTRGRGGDAARRWGDRRRGGHHLARRGPAPIAGGGAHPCSRSCQAAERCPRWHRSAVGGSELAVCASLSSNAGGVRRCALRRLMHALRTRSASCTAYTRPASPHLYGLVSTSLASQAGRCAGNAPAGSAPASSAPAGSAPAGSEPAGAREPASGRASFNAPARPRLPSDNRKRKKKWGRVRSSHPRPCALEPPPAARSGFFLGFSSRRGGRLRHRGRGACSTRGGGYLSPPHYPLTWEGLSNEEHGSNRHCPTDTRQRRARVRAASSPLSALCWRDVTLTGDTLHSSWPSASTGNDGAPFMWQTIQCVISSV